MDLNKHVDFSNKELWHLILPLILEQFLSVAVGLADSMMVAQVGDSAVSGVSLVDSISVLMQYIFSAMAAGGVAVCCQYLGRQDSKLSKKAGHHLVLLMTVVSIVITALLYIFSNLIITKLFGSIDADVMDATRKYYMIVMASVPAIAIYNAGAGIFRAMEKTSVTLTISLIMNGINVAGNAVLIFALKYGVEGVAIPTLVSRWVAAILVVILLFNKKYILNLRDIWHFKLEKKILKNIFTFSVPSGVENGMFQLGKIILFSFISTMGTASITANAIGGTMASFHVIPGNAINLAMATVVGQCVGAGAFDKAKFYFRKLLKWVYIISAVWITLIIIFTPTILKIYNVSEEATHLAYIVCMLHAVNGILIWPLGFVTPTFLRSAGDTTFTMIASALSMWFVRVVAGIVLAKVFGLGVVGVWIAHTILDWIVRSIIFFVRYKKNKWMTKAIKQ